MRYRKNSNKKAGEFSCRNQLKRKFQEIFSEDKRLRISVATKNFLTDTQHKRKSVLTSTV